MKTSIKEMLMHPNDHRIYLNCIDINKIHCVEVASGIVVQTLPTAIKVANGQKIPCQMAITTCGTIFYTALGNEITAWHNLNEKELHSIQILPIDLDMNEMRPSAYISSISIHSKMKTLLSCALYGATDITAMFLYNDRNDMATARIMQPQHVQSTDCCVGDMADTEKEAAVDRWQQIRHEIIATEQNNMGTFDDILERIDDLFYMAIKSPNRTDDYKENIVRHKNENVKRLLCDRSKFTMDSSGGGGGGGSCSNNIIAVTDTDDHFSCTNRNTIHVRDEDVREMTDAVGDAIHAKQYTHDSCDSDTDSNNTFVVETVKQSTIVDAVNEDNKHKQKSVV